MIWDDIWTFLASIDWVKLWKHISQGTLDTLYMTLPSTFFAYVIGLPLGVLLVITRKGNIRPAPSFNAVLGAIINFLRSIPFIILLVMLFPVTRAVMGTAIGTKSVIFPLVISAFPYVARMVESSLQEVDGGVIEAAISMGSTTWQIICKVLLAEALPSLVNGATICLTTILAYTAMAGAAGGDGLSKIAISYGLNRREYVIMYAASIALVLLVQIFQVAGTMATRKLDHKKR
jgi:D-methionine transport system permease protein